MRETVFFRSAGRVWTHEPVVAGTKAREAPDNTGTEGNVQRYQKTYQNLSEFSNVLFLIDFKKSLHPYPLKSEQRQASPGY